MLSEKIDKTLLLTKLTTLKRFSKIGLYSRIYKWVFLKIPVFFIVLATENFFFFKQRRAFSGFQMLSLIMAINWRKEAIELESLKTFSVEKRQKNSFQQNSFQIDLIWSFLLRLLKETNCTQTLTFKATSDFQSLRQVSPFENILFWPRNFG